MEETTIEDILMAQNGDNDMLNNIVEKNSRLIWSIVKRFKNGKNELEDLYQIGAIGLIKSIKRFDKKYNVKLSTFAVPHIIGEIKRFLRDDGTIKVSRSLKELKSKIDLLKKEYEKKGKELSLDLICNELKESKENVLLALELENQLKSIDEELNDGKENLYNLIKVKSHEDETIRNIVLKEELDKLEKKERTIILLRYFYNKTQSEIAERLRYKSSSSFKIGKENFIENEV